MSSRLRTLSGPSFAVIGGLALALIGGGDALARGGSPVENASQCASCPPTTGTTTPTVVTPTPEPVPETPVVSTPPSTECGGTTTTAQRERPRRQFEGGFMIGITLTWQDETFRTNCNHGTLRVANDSLAGYDRMIQRQAEEKLARDLASGIAQWQRTQNEIQRTLDRLTTIPIPEFRPDTRPSADLVLRGSIDAATTATAGTNPLFAPVLTADLRGTFTTGFRTLDAERFTPRETAPAAKKAQPRARAKKNARATPAFADAAQREQQAAQAWLRRGAGTSTTRTLNAWDPDCETQTQRGIRVTGITFSGWGGR